MLLQCQQRSTLLPYRKLRKWTKNWAIENLANASLNLQKLTINGGTIYYNILDGCVSPYLLETLCRKVFTTVHDLSHPSGKATSRALKDKFIWSGIKKDALNSHKNAYSASAQRFTNTHPKKIDVLDQRFNHIHLDIIILSQISKLTRCRSVLLQLNLQFWHTPDDIY